MIQINENTVTIPLNLLKEHPLNEVYHSDLDPGPRAMLFHDIKENGIRYPIIVHEADNTVLSGSKRCKIWAELGNKEIVARLVKCTDEDAEYLLVAENKARRGTERDLIKVAKQIKFLFERWGIKPGRKSVHEAQDKTRHDAAEQIGMSDSNARRYMQLLDLSEDLQQLVSQEKIKLKAGVKLSRLPNEVQHDFYEYVKEKGYPEMCNKEVYKVISLLTSLEEIDLGKEDLSQFAKEEKEIQKLQKKVISMTTRSLDRLTAERLLHIFKNGMEILEGQIGKGDVNVGEIIN
jgi:ParB-like chromosome segregation protein Spo0J